MQGEHDSRDSFTEPGTTNRDTAAAGDSAVSLHGTINTAHFVWLVFPCLFIMSLTLYCLLNTGRYEFVMKYSHSSPGGDGAAVLLEQHFIRYVFSHHF